MQCDRLDQRGEAATDGPTKKEGDVVRNVRVVLVAFAATVCGSLVIAESASALPEVGRCVAQAGGKYKDASCTEKVTGGEFEFLKGAKSETEGSSFTVSGGEQVIESISGSKFECKTASGSGKYDEDSGVIKEVESLTINYKECELPVFSAKCKSTGAAEGEIRTKLLKGPLGYISGERTKFPSIGLELTPEASKGLFEEYECGGFETVQVKGDEGSVEGKTGGNCVISTVSEANEMSTTFTQLYKGSAGKQEPQHFQLSTSKFCNLEVSTNGGAYEALTWAQSLTITNEEALEIKA